MPTTHAIASPTSPNANSYAVRRAAERGTSRFGWLDSRHSFSFGGYHDPRRMGYHGLRVLNDDRVAPGMGFDTHPHRDMEILTWVLDGELAHRDSLGHASVLPAGGLQLMSAGSGVSHSEFNAREDAPVHFLQVWLQPRERGTEPRYQERAEPGVAGGGPVRLAATGRVDRATEGVMALGADAEVYVGTFDTAGSDTLLVPAGRVAYVHAATGTLTVEGQTLSAGDALTVEDPSRSVTLNLAGQPGARLIAFVLPA
ncbi:MAG: pirin family protein [Planctomycetota bacterium]